MSTRNNASRLVRTRKLNPKQGLRIIRESDIEEQFDDESQRQVHQVETGVEKAEEIEYHLQAVINASNATALGARAKQSYIPTPDTVRAKGVKYDELYPKVFKDPATYIRFSSTVEESIGVAYCMNDEDGEFLSRLNDGKDADGRDRKDKLSQCSEDTFEEVMNVFEETSARLQPFANVDSAPILSLDEMERAMEEDISADAQKWLKPVYQYWVLRKGSRPLMPAIKVRVLDTASEADDADPYICFRRREVRLTRKTRGRDAQVVEKLKKLRLEAESALSLVRLVVERERLKADSLQTDRRVFNERKQLKEVKAAKNIIGDKADDEELLVNQKPITKTGKGRGDGQQQRPATIRIRSNGDPRSAAPDVDLPLLEDWRAEAEQFVTSTIDARKEQHKKWNQHWVDETKFPITPPLKESDPMAKWAQFPLHELNIYPTPPPSLPSHSSQEKETEDVEMQDAPPKVEEVKQAIAGAEPEEPRSVFHIPGAYPLSDAESDDDSAERSSYSACRLRYGRGGRCYLESRKRRPYGQLSRGVVSDSESDQDDGPAYFSERITFDYRAALNNRPTRPDGMPAQQPSSHGRWASGEQSAMMTGTGAHPHPQVAAGGAA